MAQWIISQFERPSSETVAAFSGIATGILSDCMNRQMAMDASMHPLVRSHRVCGPAFTVQSVEANNWGAHQAIEMAQPGDVIVIAARGATTAALWGHVMTVAASRRKIAGVVIDGCVRDSQENEGESFPIFSRGICPAGPHKSSTCNLNVPVSCAGVPVLPGDIVVGDGDGVVVVPRARASEVLEAARKRIAMEQDWYRRLEKGESTLSLLGIEAAKGHHG